MRMKPHAFQVEKNMLCLLTFLESKRDEEQHA